MEYKPKQSYSNSDERERLSVNLINEMLRGHSILAHINIGDKGANIDGFLELLDEERRISGKLTVQVKTVSPIYEGKYKFPCPTSLFAYADRTMDVVLLLAVDHSVNIVLWKYISHALIEQNRENANQDSITLYFDESERLSFNNVSNTVKAWNKLFLDERKLYKEAIVTSKENEQLRMQLVHAESTSFDLPKLEVAKIQSFSDMYNSLLDRELLPIKKWCYPDSWKQGFAIHTYTEHQLYYSQYSILYGENSLLVKQLPKEESNRKEFQSARLSFIENEIRSDYIGLVKKKIKEDVKRFILQKEIPPLYDYYIIEFIRGFILSNRLILHIPPSLLQNYGDLVQFVQQNFSTYSGKVVPLMWNNYRIRIDIINELAKYLIERGYMKDIQQYPSKGHYADTGFVWDYFSPAIAFEKMRIVINYVYMTYTNYIQNNFPLISSSLDMFDNADFALINLSYTNTNAAPHIRVHCFYRSEHINTQHKTTIEYSLNRSNDLYEQILEPDDMRLVGKNIHIHGEKYECRLSTSFNTNDVLFSDTCLINTFKYVLKKGLVEYVEKRIK